MKAVTADDPQHVFDRMPFMGLLQMKRVFSLAGRAQLYIEGRPELGNVIGAIHGGVTATLLDVVMASAAVSKLDFKCTAITLNMTASFLQPGRERLTADGEVIAHDDHMAWCVAVVKDANGSIVARGQGTFRYVPFPQAVETTKANVIPPA